MCFAFDALPPDLPADLALPRIAGGAGAERPELIRADMAAAIAALRERIGTERFAAVGFCFGASQAFLAAADPQLPLAGVVGFYGRLTSARPNMPSPKEQAAQTRIPVLGLFGGADEAIPQEDVEAFGRGLQAAGVRHELEVYPGAPHSFFDRAYEQHAEACADAWRRTLAFLDGLA